MMSWVLFAACLTFASGRAGLVQKLIDLNGLLSVGSSSRVPLPWDFLEADRLITREGYRFEQYQVITQDGYILELQRIRGQRRSHGDRAVPVFMMHGFVAASDTFVARGRQNDLAFMLTDFGYDVWLGNARGNTYSKGHKRLAESDPAYWNFSVHEIAVYDLPALIDRVLALTGHSRLFYVGYSMSTTMFLIMTSMRPEFNQKIILSLLMAPVASEQPLSELVSPLIRAVVENNSAIRDALKIMNVTEILPRTAPTVAFIRSACGETLIQPFCVFIFGLLVGQHPSNLNLETLGEQAAHFVAGSSVDTFFHITEIIKKGLKPLDYGPKDNLIKYNSTEPPEYKLERVTCPIAIFYSDNDSVSSIRGSFRLAKRLPNLRLMKEMPQGYTHADYVFGLDSVQEVNAPIIKLFSLYNAS